MSMSNPDQRASSPIDFTGVEKVVVGDPRVRELARLTIDEVITEGVLLGVRDALTHSGDELRLAGLNPLVINDAIGDSDNRLLDYLSELKQTLREKTADQITDLYLRNLAD